MFMFSTFDPMYLEDGEQEKDRMLLQCFDVVIQEFQALKPE